ncbi:MerR family transcriptional regulator [Kibdelosporangium persicum]|uniref:Heavy metal-responsive transcriptional regulator n=1 Tax=Kibdelosporangium persicum TaxID=2698649 RepID=A0ABX2F4Q6_9PSEU|nr:MerR family transcriptional regulator [Kibdelosporangium persicum]NRN65805.1 Heavy metal-responsive transcriptional regulator [Kibdelosporangium persicum]
MRIGEASAAAGLTPRALRYYEERGLLAARRTTSGHREYDEEDVHRLRIVRELLAAGLTISDVQAVVEGLDMPLKQPGDCPIVDITNRRLAELDKRIERLTELRRRLANALTHRFDKQFHRPDQQAVAMRRRLNPCERQISDEFTVT